MKNTDQTSNPLNHWVAHASQTCTSAKAFHPAFRCHSTGMCCNVCAVSMAQSWSANNNILYLCVARELLRNIYHSLAADITQRNLFLWNSACGQFVSTNGLLLMIFRLFLELAFQQTAVNCLESSKKLGKPTAMSIFRIGSSSKPKTLPPPVFNSNLAAPPVILDAHSNTVFCCSFSVSVPDFFLAWLEWIGFVRDMAT